MAKLGGRLSRAAGRLGLRLLIPLFVGMSIWTTVPLFGMNSVELPEVPPVDQVTLDQATNSQSGKALVDVGYKATIKISDEDLIKFLDQEEKKAGLANPGPYVVFSLDKPKLDKADTNVAPDRVVDVANGAIVALSQEFTNGRGSLCYNAKTVEILDANWVLINEYLRGKSMPQQIPVTRELVPQLISGFPDTNCFVYPTS